MGQTQLKIFTCEYCNKVFKFKHSLQAHLRIHTNEKPFKCSQCDYASAIKANLSVHMRKHTGEKFSCEHCSFNCLSKGHLKVHVERVHQKIKQHCRFCKKKYSDVKNLLKHIRESHDMEDGKVKDSYDEYRLQTREGKRQLLYDCHVCDRKFKYELERDRHLMVHGSNRPYGCELCDHGSTKFQALQAHVRKHPFVYVCSVCQQKFVSTVRLKMHFSESHPGSDESTTFADSIKSSFCLLKPGDDIQRDMLKQDELEISKELSLLNAQEVLATETDSIEEQEAEGPASLTTEELVHDPPEDIASTELSNCPVIHASVAEEAQLHGRVSEDLLDKEQVQDNLPNVECSVTELNNPGEENTHLPTSETPVMSEHVTTDMTVTENESSVTQSSPPPSAMEDLATTEVEDKSAFVQILEQMQKRQLNMEVFERIRKVYGDLECEYCGNRIYVIFPFFLTIYLFFVFKVSSLFFIGKLFWYQVHYNMHVRTHTREHLHYCSQCSYSSITKNCLKRHVIQRHSNVLLKCPSEGCQYSTPDKYKLQAHLKTHTEIVSTKDVYLGKGVEVAVCCTDLTFFFFFYFDFTTLGKEELCVSSL